MPLSHERRPGTLPSIALASALECSATLDVLVAKRVLDGDRVEEGKELLERIAAMIMAMLKKLGRTL
jgi:hypothetical protein